MRLFFMGWDERRADHAAVAFELCQAGHEIVYWTTPADEVPEEKEKFASTVWHNIVKASWAIPAPGVSQAGFYPPGKGLIAKMSEVESMVLTMMNKRFDWMSTDERRHLYYDLLEYWAGVMGTYRPEAVIFSLIPHTVYDYIVYELARRSGVKTIMFDDILISDRLLVLNDFRRGSDRVVKALEDNQGKDFTPQDLSPDLRDYYLGQLDKKRDATPRYVLEDQQQYAPQKLFLKKLKVVRDSLRDYSVLTKTYGYFLKLIKDNPVKDYRRNQTEPDFSKKFVYLPLNYQPECTSSPQGDAYADQILMIKTVAASLPPDWWVYVKEHPVQWLGRGLNYYGSRYRGYYQKIAAIPRVRLMPMTAGHYELISASQAVVTLTGTAGLEALIRGKPVIVFGYPWYQNCPLLLRASDVQSCREAINKIINGFKVREQEVVNFLAALDRGTIRAYLSSYTERTSALSASQNARQISQVLLKELEI